MEISIGEIILDEEIKLGNIELDVVKEYPYLENLEITPTAGQQIFTHPDSYGYNEVKVDAINLQDKSVTPTQAQQIIFADIGYSGLNNVKIEAATSDIDSNIQSYNIKKDITILGVTGNVIELNGEERTATPTKDTQVITPSTDKNAITKMTVNPIPDEYIIPSGEINISQNGTYDVTDKASANVNIPEKVLGTKTITSNGTYKAVDDNLDGYSQVNVETSGVNIWDYFIKQVPSNQGQYIYYIKKLPVVDTSNLRTAKYMFSGFMNLQEVPFIDTSKVTTMSYMFSNCSKLTEVPLLDTSSVTDMSSMFSNCSELKTIPLFNTSNVTTMYGTFSGCAVIDNLPLLDTSKVTRMNDTFKRCYDLKKIPEINTQNVTSFNSTFYDCTSLYEIPALNASKVTDVNQMFIICKKLKDFGGLINLGEAYNTRQSANISSYKLTLDDSPELTHDSLMNVINNLYDIKTKGCNPQGLVLGSTNMAKLTSEEIAIATNKGWIIS